MKLMTCVILAAALMGCDSRPDSSADEKQQKATEQAMNEAQRQVGMPNIVNFQERKLMKQIMELRDKEDLVTFAYIVNLHGELIYIGQCIGFGLPYTVQFTNPEKVVHETRINGGSFGTLPQPDPNGLFMPQGLSATWLMMLDPKTKEVRPVYVEPEIVVSPFKLH